jgi:stage II sporulation protein D
MTVTGGTVYFSGMGYGHGVGMPQTSAREMANQGYGYQDILRYYYTGVDIRQANELLD